jgi:hypothetical protein
MRMPAPPGRPEAPAGTAELAMPAGGKSIPGRLDPTKPAETKKLVAATKPRHGARNSGLWSRTPVERKPAGHSLVKGFMVKDFMDARGLDLNFRVARQERETACEEHYLPLVPFDRPLAAE